MAHNMEPMDIDNIESDFDNKENTYHHSNVLPCTEKGYEELDVSELNMKLRYSFTPASSPMSKSYTANTENRNTDESLNALDNVNLTQSFNSVMNKDTKAFKLQALPLYPKEQDSNRNSSVLRPLDATHTLEDKIKVTVTDIDESSFPSPLSSSAHTPEATTPTKDPRADGGSPIMRGLKSVLNMFRSSQSPIPPTDGEDTVSKHDMSPNVDTPKGNDTGAQASTPIAERNKDSPIRSSPHKDSVVFNDDLEKELLWKDETTILFSQEKIPIHKLFLQTKPQTKAPENKNLNDTVEFMDVSCNDSIGNTTITKLATNNVAESDGEFVDCETTFTESDLLDKQSTDKTFNTKPQLDPLEVTSVANTTQVIDSNALSDNPIISETFTKQSIDRASNNIVSDTFRKENQSNNATITIGAAEQQIENQNQFDATKTLNALTNTFTKEINENLLKNTINVVEPPIIKNEKQLDITKTINTAESKVILTKDTPNVPLDAIDSLSSTFTKDGAINSTVTISSDITKGQFNVDSNEQPNTTIIIEHACKEKLTINDITQNIDSNESFDVNSKVGLNTTTVIDTAKETPVNVTHIVSNELPSNATVTIKEAESTSATFTQEDIESKNNPAEAIASATFTRDNTPYNPNTVLLDATVTIDPKENDEKFNVTNVIDKHENSNNSNTFAIENIQDATFEIRDSNVTIELEDKTIAATSFIKPQETLGATVTIEELDINLSLTKKPKSVIEELTESLAKSENVCDVEKVGIKTFVIKPQFENIQPSFENTVNLQTNDSNEDIILIKSDNTYIENSNIPLNPDILCDSINDVSENIQLVANQENIIDDSIKTSLPKQTPADVPLPDEDDLDTETHVTKDNKNNSIILPDIINLLNTSKVEDINEIEAMPNDTINQAKLTADLINDIILDKDIVNTEQNEKINNIDNRLEEYNDKDLNLLNNIQKQREATNNSLVTNGSGIIEIESVETPATTSINIEQTTQSQTYIPESVTEITTTNIDAEKSPVQPETSLSENVTSIQNQPETEVPINVSNLVEKIDITENTDNNEIFEITKNNMDSVDGHDKIHEENINLNVFKDIKITDSIQEKSEIDTLHCNIKNQLEVLKQNISLEEMDVDKSIEINNVENSPSQNDTKTKNQVLLEDIIDSENNSSYVLVSAAKEENPVEDFEKIENPFAKKSKLSISPPLSPKIFSKGYNFDFDNIDDPFATKVNIRMSPPLDSPKQISEKVECPKPVLPKNRRKSQPVPKKPAISKKTFNTTIDCGLLDSKDILVEREENVDEEKKCEFMETDSSKLLNNSVSNTKLESNVVGLNQNDKSELQINIDNTTKSEKENKSPLTSSSERSTYYSVPSSSGDSSITKNVFNLPEIDDINFNPFVTKSKIRLSPPPDSTALDSSVQKQQNDITHNVTIDKNIDVQGTANNKSGTEERDFDNVTNTTCSSKASDEKDITVREIHTDDEDTIEGPFLEAEELIGDKVSDIDSEHIDMMQLTPQANEDNEMFIDAEAFEFLLNQNKTNVVADSGKESLFLKFDPLFAKRMSSDGIVSALTKIQKRQSTPKKQMTPRTNEKSVVKPIPRASTSNVILPIEANPIDESADELSTTISKPMMVVTPAVNPVAAPRKSTTPINTNRRSITFTSPAIAVIDRLLSLSANNSLVENEFIVNREQNEAELALTQLRELLAEKEIHVYGLRSESKELKDRLLTLETQMKSLERESEVRLKKVNELTKELTEKTQINKSMAAVVEEYERTIASLIAETEQDKKRHHEERMALIRERDEQTAHLASMEGSFSDLHSKYEKSKQLIYSCKANEDKCLKSIKDFEESLAKMQNNYELLKQHATSKLNHANQELEKMNRTHEAEVLKLNAMLKRKDLHITSLEETLAQKTKANEELTAICDELINKVG